MAILEIRQRTGWLFVAVVVGHIILISTQARTGASGATLFDSVVFGTFAEVQRFTSGAVSGVTNSYEDYFALQQIRRENEQLKQELAELQIRMQRESEAASQARALEGLLDLRAALPFETTAARVIGGAASPEFRTITIDKGTDDGLRADMAVVAPTGVVGRIIQPTRRAAKVQLLIDTDAAAGAVVERTRVQGIVVGTKTAYRLDYISSSADIKVGDRIVTSGAEGIFPTFPDDAPDVEGRYPRGFVIGHIESLQRGSGQYTNVVVRPSVDLGSLETVLVVLTPGTSAGEDAAGGAPDPSRNGTW
jgi:rod shape-determining protein MreC